MVNIDGLRAAGLAERKLAQKDIDKQKAILAEFKEDPQIAKALEYLDRYNEVIPETHPIFQYIQRLKEVRDGKQLVKEAVKSKKSVRQARKEKEEAEEKKEEEEKAKKVEECKICINKLLDDLEGQNDKAFEYLEKNMKTFASAYPRMSEALKLKRFLISVKGGIKNMRFK